jgi:hypothetical protein
VTLLARRDESDATIRDRPPGVLERCSDDLKLLLLC